MASSYSTNLAIELIGTGDQAGTWGVTTNTNLGTLIEQAISGYVTQAVSTGGDTTITIPNGATGVARNMYIELTGTGGASTNLIVPSNKKLYFIYNNTASGQVTVKVAGQTGVSVPNGAKMILVSNGTDIVDATNYVGNISAASGNITVLTSASATITNLLATSLTVSSGSTLNGGVVVNEPGADVDFRVEGDTDANLLFVDASADNVGIGTSSPAQRLDVRGAANSVQARFGNVAGRGLTIGTAIVSGTNDAGVVFNAPTTEGAFLFQTVSDTKMTLSTSGNLGLGVTPSAWGSAVKAYQVGNTALVGTSTQAILSQNYYFDGSADKYISNGFASFYYQINGTHEWRTAPSGTAGDPITFTTPMKLDASGNLGVGETSPSSRLHVSATSAEIILEDSDTARGSNPASLLSFYGSDARAGYIGYPADSNMYITQANNNAMLFLTNNTERARISAAGEVLFSTTDAGLTSSAGFKYLPAGGGAGIPYIGLVGDSGSDTGVTYRLYSTTAAAYRFYVGYGGTVYATNTTISSTSDVRLKENIRDLDVGLDAVMALKPRKFDWKPGKGRDKKDDRGFIAQELEQVFPDLIDDWLDPAPEGEEPYKSVRQDLIPVLVKAIQELKAELDEAKAKISALEGAN